MQKPGRILAAIPPTELDETLAARAFEIGRRFSASVHLMGVVYDPYVAGERFSDSPGLERARAELVARRRERLEELAGADTAKGIDVTVTAQWCYPVVDGVMQALSAHSPDMVLAGTFHHSPLRRIGLINTDWQLIRDCPMPLLLVRGDGSDGYTQVMAAVDPMHGHDKPASLDRDLIAAGRLFAGAWNGRLHIVHAYLSGQYVPFVAPGAALPPPFDTEEPSTLHRRAMEALVADAAPADAQVLLESGDARQLLPELAERVGAKLVVMGAVARSRLRRWLIGSTAESVLDRLDCDVLIVKPGAD